MHEALCIVFVSRLFFCMQREKQSGNETTHNVVHDLVPYDSFMSDLILDSQKQEPGNEMRLIKCLILKMIAAGWCWFRLDTKASIFYTHYAYLSFTLQMHTYSPLVYFF